MSRRPIAAAVAVLAILSACEKKDSGFMKQLKEMSDASRARAGGGGNTQADPCGLLDPDQVAAAIGPLAGPPYRGSFRPAPNGNTCRYDTKDHRRMLVTVDWSGGQIAMKMIGFGRSITDAASKSGETKTGKIVLSSGDTLSGAWDQVSAGPMSCCDLHALRGDRHVELDWTGTRLTTPAAGTLLSSAVQHLDQPLPINGQAGLAAAEQNFAADARDSAVNMCNLVPQAAAESALGTKLSGPPQPGSSAGAAGLRDCTYKTAMPGSPQMQRTYELTLWEWRDGAVEFAKDQYIIGGASHLVGKTVTGDTTSAAKDSSQGPAGPWDEIGPSASMGWEAVKGPVMLKGAAMGDDKGEQALLARALTALNAQH